MVRISFIHQARPWNGGKCPSRCREFEQEKSAHWGLGTAPGREEMMCAGRQFPSAEGRKVNDSNRRWRSKSPAFSKWPQRLESTPQRADRGSPVRGRWQRVPWSMAGHVGRLPGQMDGLASGCSSCCFWSFHINKANISLEKHLYQ